MTSLIHRIFGANVYPHAIVSPLHPMRDLSRRLGRTVYQKREDRQPGHSFKVRGAAAKIMALSAEELARGVVCASAGNHAQGVARACAFRGVRPTIFMPATVARAKLGALARFNPTVVLEGDYFHEALQAAREWTRRRHAVWVDPFDDAAVIAGQGTVGLEIARQHPDPIDAVFVPIGGGGLAAGVATALRMLKPGTRVVGVEAEDAPTMTAAFRAGGPVSLAHVGRLADGAAVRQAGDLTYDLCHRLLDDIVLVRRGELQDAIAQTARAFGVVPEPAGALALAGLQSWVRRGEARTGALVAVLSGANVDRATARSLLKRADQPLLSLLPAADPALVPSVCWSV